jgi:hypothetical protein
MKQVWKYRLALTSNAQSVLMPLGTQVLSLQLQLEEPVLWAKVYTEAPVVPRYFAFVGTGLSVPENSGYVGTLLLENGSRALHLFELMVPGRESSHG